MSDLISVPFQRDTAIGSYSDCLYFSTDDYALLDDTALEALIDARVNNWIDFVTAANQSEGD